MSVSNEKVDTASDRQPIEMNNKKFSPAAIKFAIIGIALTILAIGLAAGAIGLGMASPFTAGATAALGVGLIGIALVLAELAAGYFGFAGIQD
jgi:hypothetical protein